MLQSLLVPLDGSEFSERTLFLAQALAKATGGSLHLAHVQAFGDQPAQLRQPGHAPSAGRGLLEEARLLDGDGQVGRQLFQVGDVIRGERVRSVADQVQHAEAFRFADDRHADAGQQAFSDAVCVQGDGARAVIPE